MKLNKLLLTTTLIATALIGGHANAVDQTGNASATIVQGLAVNETTAMDFSSIVPDAAGDTITMDTAGARSATGSSTFQGTGQAGVFGITGNPSSAITISFSTGDVLSGPGADMSLSNFAHDAGGSPALDGSGALTLNVGADLGINAAQTAGAYSGTYTISVDYP